MIIVIPSSREINLNYIKPLIDTGARFIIVDDTEGSIKIDHPQFRVFNWGDRKKIVGNLAHGLPQKNGACRDLGFLIAWKESDPNEIIVALDDDCEVTYENFSEKVTEALQKRTRKLPEVNGIHYNILDTYKGTEDNIYPRGFPYSERLNYKKPVVLTDVVSDSSFNLGMWSGIFDVNAIDKIYGPQYKYEHAALENESVLIPKGVLASACSMNMHFRKELIPAVYQLPMHIEIMPGWKIDRYGDIWGGFILKMLMDIKGDNFTVGEPIINHLKEGKYERNIWQEHLCHLVNDEFIDIILNAQTEIKSSGYLEMMLQLNEILKSKRDNCSPILSKYLLYLNKAVDEWCTLLK